MSSPSILAPFRSRDFRLQWAADLATAWALEMELLILGWYVLVETGSVLLLTVFGSLQMVGTLLGPMMGVLGDRLGLRNVLAAMRISYAAFAGVLLAFALAERLDPTVVLAVSALSGLVRPSDIGIRSALASSAVPAPAVAAAMGISRTTQDSARVAGALAGAGLIAVYGMAPAYMAITGIYLLGALLTLTVAAQRTAPPRIASSPWRDLREGLAYVWSAPRLRAAMSLAALVNLTAFPLTSSLLPYIARHVLGLDQKGLGLMVACVSAGAFVGSLAVGLLGARIRPARTMVMAAVLWYLALIAFVLAESVATALVLLVVAGIAQSISMVTLMILLLKTSDERFRGRVIGVRLLAVYTLPVGLLLSGWLITSIGYRQTALLMLAAGLLLTLEIAVNWRDDLLRPNAVANAR